MNHRYTGVLGAGLVMAICLTACSGGTSKSSSDASAAPAATASGSADPSAKLKTGLNVLVVPKQIGLPYNIAETKGASQALTELGEIPTVSGPTEGGGAAQLPFVNTGIQKKNQAILVAASDKNALCPALQPYMQSGGKVVTFDADLNPACRNLFVNQASSKDIGVIQVQILGEQMNYTGDFAILSSTPNAPNQTRWIEFMKEELKDPKYANMKLVDTAYGGDTDATAFSQVQGLLAAHPTIKGIISPTTVGISAAARYISTSSYNGKVFLTGLGLPNTMRPYVKSGVVQEFALWNVNDMGYLAGQAAVNLVSGTITGAQGEKFKAGKLGEYTIGAAGEIILGPPLRFNKDNIDKFDF